MRESPLSPISFFRTSTTFLKLSWEGGEGRGGEGGGEGTVTSEEEAYVHVHTHTMTYKYTYCTHILNTHTVHTY